MATHDYVISNASGAAVRADLNNALAAIVSNNSNATEPSTTYAYMLWADTGSSPPVMKLRNAANDGWVTLFQLDGEWSSIAFEDGSAAAPSIYFKDSGTDTGLFSGGTDQVNITTGGTERVEWGASEVVFNDGGENYDFRIEGDTNANLFFVDASADAVGIGTTAPSTPLNVLSGAGTEGDATALSSEVFRIRRNTASDSGCIQSIIAGTAGAAILAFGDKDSSTIGRVEYDNSTNSLNLWANNSERARIDSSGRLLVGTSTARADLVRPNINCEGLTNAGITICRNNADASGPTLEFGKTRSATIGGNTAVANNDQLGAIRFFGANGTDFSNEGAGIAAFVDGDPFTAGDTTDLPTRLTFSTTADGQSSPTERMRIRADGSTNINGGVLFGGSGNPGTAFYIAGAILPSGTGTSTLKWNGNTGQVTYDTSSSLVKTNIEESPYGLEAVKQLSPKKYYRVDDEKTEIGFIADDLVDVLPELVPTGPKSIITREETDTEIIPLGINYDRITAVLVKALQEAAEKIETLEAKVAALETQ